MTATTFRPLLLAVAAVAARPVPAAGRPAYPARRPVRARDRILAHSLGRRGPPCSVALG
ncbi:Integral membrane protein OS=Streptomyces fumanus OX=67302 GN=GCM10018772_67700 PE=4 SV=1 [Streptomyces fumanus]